MRWNGKQAIKKILKTNTESIRTNKVHGFDGLKDYQKSYSD